MNVDSIIHIFNEAVDLAKRAKDIDLNEKLMELQQAVMKLSDENHELNEELRRLKSKEDIEAKLMKKGAFWQLPDKPYYYCPKCWGKDKNLVPCIKSDNNEIYSCPVCRYWAYGY